MTSDLVGSGTGGGWTKGVGMVIGIEGACLAELDLVTGIEGLDAGTVVVLDT